MFLSQDPAPIQLICLVHCHHIPTSHTRTLLLRQYKTPDLRFLSSLRCRPRASRSTTSLSLHPLLTTSSRKSYSRASEPLVPPPSKAHLHTDNFGSGQMIDHSLRAIGNKFHREEGPREQAPSETSQQKAHEKMEISALPAMVVANTTGFV